VNPGDADSLATYRMATAGKKGSFTAKNAQVIKLKSAAYNAANNMVTLTPKKAFALTKPVQLLVDGVPPLGLQDSLGRLIDGDHNGQPGGNAVAVLSKGGVKLNAVVAGGEWRVAGEDGNTRLYPAAVDALLERPEAIAVKHTSRAERSTWDETATNQRRVKREELVPGMAQIRVEWKPPLQPWTEWAPSVDRFAVAFGPAPRSSGDFTFESSGLARPGRRSEGSAERRKRSRPS